MLCLLAEHGTNPGEQRMRKRALEPGFVVTGVLRSILLSLGPGDWRTCEMTCLRREASPFVSCVPYGAQRILF
jgi:hypothetical protein